MLKKPASCHVLLILSAAYVSVMDVSYAFSDTGFTEPPPMIQQEWIPSPCSDPLNFNELSLVEAIRASLCDSPKVRQSALAIAEEKGNIGVAEAKYYPTLEAKASANRIGKHVDYPDASYADYDLNAYSGNADLGLRWLLYDSGQRGASLDKAQAMYRAALYNQVLARRDQAIAVADDYYRAASAEAGVASASLAIERSEQNFRISQRLVKGGVGAVTDELLAKSSWQRSLVEHEEKVKSAALARATLASSIGLVSSAPIQLKSASSLQRDRPKSPLPPANIEALIHAAMMQNPRLRAARARTEAAVAESNAIATQNSPTVALYGNRSFNLTPPADSIMKQNVNAWSVGLQLNIPLFDGFSTRNASAAARERTRAAEQEERTARHEEELKLVSDYQSLQSGQRRVSLLVEAETSSKLAYDASLVRYKEGIGTVVELLKAQEELAKVQQDLIQTRYEVLAAQFRVSVEIDTLPALPPHASTRN